MPCDLCGKDEPRTLFVGRDYDLGGCEPFPVVECGSCGFAYVTPRPTQTRLGAFYPPDYEQYDGRTHWWIEASRAWVTRRQAGRIRKVVAPGARLLDVGCGLGGLVARLRADGFAAEGLEPSEHPRQMARSRYGLELLPGTLTDNTLPSGSYDLVSMCHVLEHVPRPSESLEGARRILKPGGWLFVEVPHYRCPEARIFGKYWGGWQLPRHLSHFTAGTLHRLARTHGFEVVHSRWVPTPSFGGGARLALADWVAPGRPVPRWLAGVRPAVNLLAWPVTLLLSGLLGRPSCVLEILARRTSSE